jgi:Lrp/AsnC family transcriptional regulator
MVLFPVYTHLGATEGVVMMDRFDLSILDKVQRDASLSVGELADQVGISKSACWRRLQKLEENGVIRQRVTLLNPEKVGLTLTVYISVRTNQHNKQWAKKFRSVVESIPGILEVYRMGGELDYLLKAVVADMPDYDRLYQDLIRADLFDVSAGFVMEEIKYTTALPLSPKNIKVGG